MEELRRQVAICTRLLVNAGILSYSGHVSARLPNKEHFLIQTFDDPRDELDPARLLVCDMDGNVVQGDGEPPFEVYIHSEILRARPEIGAVTHFHHDPTTVFSMIEGGEILPMKNHASRFAGGVPTHPDPTHIKTMEQGKALAETLGSRNAAIMRAHGQVVVAEDVLNLFSDSVHLVENSMTQIQAMQLGSLLPLTPEEVKVFDVTFDRKKVADKVWKYYLSVGKKNGTIPKTWD